jgi:hypothetical protein
MDSAYISALAALAGSSIGAFATFATTWLNQSYQNRIKRHANERGRRERLFGEFINEAASAYTESMANKLEDPSRLINLYSLKSRISLFSNEGIVEEADKVIQTILNRYFQENVTYREMSPSIASEFDLLRDFTKACKKEMMEF